MIDWESVAQHLHFASAEDMFVALGTKLSRPALAARFGVLVSDLPPLPKRPRRAPPAPLNLTPALAREIQKEGFAEAAQRLGMSAANLEHDVKTFLLELARRYDAADREADGGDQ